MNLQRIAVIALGLLTLVAAHAQTYPSRPVTLVVPFPPGGGTDTGARLIAQKLSAKWGQQVVVDNKGGAAGQIGADLVAKAKPDGYTILMGNIGTQAINPSLYPKLPYDPDKAFAPVSLVAELPLAMMVNLPTAGVDYHVPFGGRKGSSYGPREQGRHAAEFYTTVKTAYTQA